MAATRTKVTTAAPAKAGTAGAGTTGSPRALSGRLVVNRVLPAYQQVADQLLDLVITGSLAPGDRLPPEASLAGIFGVSRSTVREALRVLASRDIVTTTRGTTGGTFVSRVEPGQVTDYLETSLGLMSGGNDLSVADMLEARELLEVPAARLAAERREEHHLFALREAIDREVHSRGRTGKFREHRSFHAAVVEATGNGLLTVMTAPIFRVLQARFLNPDVDAAFWNQVDADHQEIYDAIRTGDGAIAGRAMHEHLQRLRPAYGPAEQ